MGIGKKKILFKLLALCVAVILWVYVANQSSMAENNVNRSKLTYNNLGEGLFIEDAPETVEVRVWGTNSNSLEIIAYVDLEGVGAGIHTLPVKLIPVKGALLTRVQPDTVSVRIAQQDSMTLPITYEVTNPPPGGYSLISVMFLPKECLIQVDEGAENVSVVVASLNLTGVKQIVEQNVALELRDKQGKVIEGALIEPRQVKAYIVVEENVVARLVNVQAQYVGAPDPNCEVTEVVVDPAQVTLIGNQTVISNTSQLSVPAVQIEGIQSDLTSLVSLEVPEGIAAYPSQVLVTVKILKHEQEQLEDETASP